MPTYAHDTFVTGTTVVGPIPASADNFIQLFNSSGGTLYYKSADSVSSSSNDGNLTAGQSVVLSAANWIVSTTAVNTLVNYLGTTQTGGVSTTSTALAKARTMSIASVPISPGATLTTYSATDTAASSSTAVYLANVFVPANCLVTGIAILNGTNVTTDKVVNYLFNSAGKMIGQTLAAGTVPVADTFQEIDLITAVNITGPAVYWIGRQTNGTTVTLQKMVAGTANMLAGTVAGTSFGAETVIVPPTTMTTNTGPAGFLY